MSAPSRNFSQELLTRTDDFNHGAAVRSEALNEFAEVLDLALGGGVRAVNNRIGLTAAFGLDQVGVHALGDEVGLDGFSTSSGELFVVGVLPRRSA